MTASTSPGESPTLEDVWDRLNLAFIDVYSEVLRKTPTVRWFANTSSNEHFLLRAHAYFPRVGREDGEALVVSVDIHQRNGVVTWTTDACMDRGDFLAEGPQRSAPATEPLSSWIGEAADASIAWFTSETPNFIAYLNQEPTPYDVD